MVELGWYGFLQLLGALALFIYGLKVMSEGVQRIATLQLRESLQRVTQSKFSSFLTGFFTTAAVQSSSATTVMTISFVNAGIISLTAAAGIIVGANAGTIVTVWLVTILGFELNLFTLCLPLIGLSMPFLFIRNGQFRHYAETVIGFSLLLLALQFMKSVVPELQQQANVMAFLGKLSNLGFLSVVIFILIGVVLTGLIQSSSAAVALTMTMCLNGWLPFDIAIAMVLGENIGTTFSTEIASWVGNYESKVAARFHVLFNVIGVVFFLPIIPLLIPFIVWVSTDFFLSANPMVDVQAMPLGLALFYSLFNLVCALVFLLFTPWLLHISARTVSAKPDEPSRLFFIDTGSNSADLSLPVVLQEIVQQGIRIKQLNSILNRITNFTTAAHFQDQTQQATTYLSTLQDNQRAINDFLINLVEDRSSLITSRQIKSLLNVSLLISHIVARYERIFQLIGQKRRQRIWFGPTQRSNLLFRIHDTDILVKRMIHVLQSKNFQKGSWKGFIPDPTEQFMHDQENEKELLEELERGELKLQSVLIYYRMGQLLDSINESLSNMIQEFTEAPHDPRTTSVR